MLTVYFGDSLTIIRRSDTQLMLSAAAKHNIEITNDMPATTKYDRSKIANPEFIRRINDVRAEYRCFCGALFVATKANVDHGGTKSCGCLRRLAHRSHGQSKTKDGKQTREYQCWQNMKRRCGDSTHQRYKDYGARGITVSPLWEDDFIAFADYMGPCPHGHTIERPDNDRGYEPGNVKWIPLAEQSRNRRGIKHYTVRGISGPLQMLCRHFKSLYGSTRLRIEQGWEIEAAIFTPRLGSAGHVPGAGPNKTRQMTFTVQGVTGSLKFLCKHFNRPYVTAKRRVRRGWTVDQAMFTAPNPAKQRHQT